MKVNYSYALIFILFIIKTFLSEPIEVKENNIEDTIYAKSNINEIYATTEVTQYFINNLQDSIELKIFFPIIDKIILSKFIIKIGDKIISSKIIEKNETEIEHENYNERSYCVNVGRINPKDKVTLKSFFIQNIDTYDMSYEFSIMDVYPYFYYERYSRNKHLFDIIKANFTIETQSKITRLVSPFSDEISKKNVFYKLIFDNDYKKAEIFYIENPVFDEHCEAIRIGIPFIDNIPTYYKRFSILFRTQNINKPMLYYQFNPELNEISYSINYVYTSEKLKDIPIPEIPDQDNTISYNLKYQNNLINETPNLFILLVEQSRSMFGKNIYLLKQSLLIFIQSLPPGSYFQLIGIGPNFKKYNEEPVEYNEKKVEEIKNIINTLDADFGYFKICEQLKSIYNDNSYSKIDLNRHIFLFSDNISNYYDECFDLIYENNNQFRFHSFGLGLRENFDESFIEKNIELGKGSYLILVDEEEISSIVIKALNSCLKPYLININFNSENYQKEIQNNIIIYEQNKIAIQDEIINYSFILAENNNINIDKLNESIIIEMYAKNPNDIVKEKFIFNKNENIIKLHDGDELSKIILKKAMKYNKELIKDKNKEKKLSIKYQVLSKSTFLFAEISDLKENNKKKLIAVNKNYYKPQNTCLNCKFGAFNRSHDFNYSFINEIKIKAQKDNMKLILSQNIIQGYWDENEETKKINNILDKDEINKINLVIKSLNRSEENENKIKYTLFVIYYLNTKCSNIIDDYILIIHKAKKYLLSQGIKYDEFIKDIKNFTQ